MESSSGLLLLLLTIIVEVCTGQSGQYFGLPLGAFHYSRDTTSAEVYAADPKTLIITNFVHKGREGCTTLMAGPYSRGLMDDAKAPNGNGVLLKLTRQQYFQQRRVKRQFSQSQYHPYFDWPFEFGQLSVPNTPDISNSFDGPGESDFAGIELDPDFLNSHSSERDEEIRSRQYIVPFTRHRVPTTRKTSPTSRATIRPTTTRRRTSSSASKETDKIIVFGMAQTPVLSQITTSTPSTTSTTTTTTTTQPTTTESTTTKRSTTRKATRRPTTRRRTQPSTRRTTTDNTVQVAVIQPRIVDTIRRRSRKPKIVTGAETTNDRKTTTPIRTTTRRKTRPTTTVTTTTTTEPTTTKEQGPGILIASADGRVANAKPFYLGPLPRAHLVTPLSIYSDKIRDVNDPELTKEQRESTARPSSTSRKNTQRPSANTRRPTRRPTPSPFDRQNADNGLVFILGESTRNSGEQVNLNEPRQQTRQQDYESSIESFTSADGIFQFALGGAPTVRPSSEAPTESTTTAPGGSTPLFRVIADPHAERRQQRPETDRQQYVQVPATPPNLPTTAAGESYLLGELNGETMIVKFDDSANVNDFEWFGIYDHCTNSRTAHVFTGGVTPPRETYIQGLQGDQHGVYSGPINIVNCNTMILTDFTYTGANFTDAYFVAGIGELPDNVIQQTFVNIVGQSPDEPIREYRRRDVTIRLPAGWKTFDINFLAVYSPADRATFGTTQIPPVIVPPCQED